MCQEVVQPLITTKICTWNNYHDVITSAKFCDNWFTNFRTPVVQKCLFSIETKATRLNDALTIVNQREHGGIGAWANTEPYHNTTNRNSSLTGRLCHSLTNSTWKSDSSGCKRIWRVYLEKQHPHQTHSLTDEPTVLPSQSWTIQFVYNSKLMLCVN